MIISMCKDGVDWSKILCITNRKLVQGDFLARIEQVAQKRPRAIVLREKDLTESRYAKLAADVVDVGRFYEVPIVLHSFVSAAESLRVSGLHLPLVSLQDLSAARRKQWQRLGTSCHSLEDVRMAEALGCSYLIAGHIFATDCKKGLPGRGVEFLREVCKSSRLPVYAIGGITPERLPEVLAAGAQGACVMSGLMTGNRWFGEIETAAVN